MSSSKKIVALQNELDTKNEFLFNLKKILGNCNKIKEAKLAKLEKRKLNTKLNG